MEELPLDLLNELERESVTKPKKSKTIERTHRVWFYGIPTYLSTCDNAECTDDRKKPLVMVWSNPEGLNMCRFCFLAGWLNAS